MNFKKTKAIITIAIILMMAFSAVAVSIPIADAKTTIDSVNNGPKPIRG